MAELKKEGRRFRNPDFPDLSGEAHAHATLGKTIQGASSAYGQYRESTDEMHNAVLYTDVSHGLKKQLIEHASPENIAQGNAAALYQQNARAIIDDALQMAPRGKSKELELKLQTVANSGELKLLALTKDYNYKKTKAAIDVAIDTAKNNYKDSLLSGDRFSIQQNKEEVEKLYTHGVALGIYNEKEKHDAVKGLHKTDLEERWTKRGENDAAAGPGISEKNLSELAREFPEEGSNEDRQIALEAYAKGASTYMTRQQAQKAINAGNVSLDILKGNITTDADIAGHDLTALQGVKAQIELYKQQHKNTKDNTKIAQFLSNVAQGNGTQNYPSSPAIKEQGHNIYKELYLNEKRQQTGDLEAQLSIEDEANILKQMNVSIPSIDAQISYAIQHANLDTEMPLVEWALGMVRTVGVETPNAIKLDAKDRAIANLANESLQYGRSNARSALEGARAVVNVDEPVLAGRRARQYKDGWEGEMRKAFKELSDGADPNTNPVAWGAFRSIYSTQAMLSDSQEVAREGARQVMTPAFGESVFFPEKSYGYLPPEKIVPFGEQGRWLESQINMKLVDIAVANHSAPSDQISNLSKIELGGDPAQTKLLVERTYAKNRNQEDLYRFRIGPQKQVAGGYIETPVTYRIAGHDRQVYLEADSSSRLNEGGKLTYSVYTMNPETNQKEPVMDPRNRTGFATITIDSLEEFLPDVYEEMNNKLYEEAAIKVTSEQYKQKRNIFLRSLAEQYFHMKVGHKKAVEQIKKNEKSYADNEEILRTESDYVVTKKDVLEEFNKGNK